METISGILQRLTFTSSETGFTVAKLQEVGKSDLTMIVGVLHGVQVGESLTCVGEWKMHPNHGLQFSVQSFTISQPTDSAGIQHYLSSGLIKGVGPVYAERIVQTFGDQTLTIIDHDPDKLRMVPGIGRTRLDQIIESWSEQRLLRKLILFLQSYQIGARYAQKIYERYGDQSIVTLKENPYQLIDTIWGIGFSTADKMALQMGLSVESPFRLSFALTFMMDQLAVEGHTCYPREQLLDRVTQLTGVSRLLIDDQLEGLLVSGKFIVKMIHEKPFIWTRSMFVCEEGILSELSRIQTTLNPLEFKDIESKIKSAEHQLDVTLASEQIEAIRTALFSEVSIITGGPGTGKSTITKIILTLFSELSNSVFLSAPTGRAAKRLSEITGHKAQTIHSLLEYDFSQAGFKFGADNPLKAQLILIDEVSMVDTNLMYSLLKAIPDHARLILVGDVNQLPSVGPGNVLSDLISLNIVSLVRLTTIFRQSSGSDIILNAHLINVGQMPKMNQSAHSDFYFLEENETESLKDRIVELVCERLPKAYSFHPTLDIQVLAPQNVGPIGTHEFNTALQTKLNPNQARIERDGKSISIGDKVIQTRNNYTKEVYNGDLGYVHDIDPEQSNLTISFDDRLVEYVFNEMDELQLAYAVTVHKFQGSEYPCVVIPVHSSNYRLLSKKLLYTAITRGKKMVVLVGSKKSIYTAIKKESLEHRFTGLRYA